jgi:pyruvate dehydrogenase E2 component (dihydrolipoamide acetyltransferase)
MEIKLPELGENVESATVNRIMVKAGDVVSKDQAIMELETEKAAVDLPSPAAGTVKEIAVKAGDTVKVGQTVMTLEDSPEAKSQQAEPSKEQPKEKAAPAEPAPSAAKEPAAKEPAKEPEKAPEKEPEAEAEAAPVPEPPAKSATTDAPATPKLRRMARELGIDIHAVKGSGPDGRISEDDVRNHARSIILNATPTGGVAGPSSLPDFSRWGDTERKAMTGIRRKTAEHEQDAWSTIPHVTQFHSADITQLEKTRQNLSKKVEEAGGKLTVTAIILKVVASALKVFPQFNVSVDVAAAEIIAKKYCHIGVAVDTEQGLLVPVLRDVDRKNILELSIELSQIAEKARNRKLTVDEMQGGCFTITNLGGIGGSHFTPIVNAPEVAILGISRAAHQAVFIDGQFQARLLLPLSLSYDHRAVDGADGARFIRWIAEALEEPFLLSLEG